MAWNSLSTPQVVVQSFLKSSEGKSPPMASQSCMYQKDWMLPNSMRAPMASQSCMYQKDGMLPNSMRAPMAMQSSMYQKDGNLLNSIRISRSQMSTQPLNIAPKGKHDELTCVRSSTLLSNTMSPRSTPESQSVVVPKVAPITQASKWQPPVQYIGNRKRSVDHALDLDASTEASDTSFSLASWVSECSDNGDEQSPIPPNTARGRLENNNAEESFLHFPGSHSFPLHNGGAKSSIPPDTAQGRVEKNICPNHGKQFFSHSQDSISLPLPGNTQKAHGQCHVQIPPNTARGRLENNNYQSHRKQSVSHSPGPHPLRLHNGCAQSPIPANTEWGRVESNNYESHGKQSVLQFQGSMSFPLLGNTQNAYRQCNRRVPTSYGFRRVVPTSYSCRRAEQTTLKFAVFDFDCTLATHHVFASLAGTVSAGDTLPIPPPFAKTEKGQLCRLCQLDADPTWGPGAFALKAFGGHGRVAQLRCILQELCGRGVECIVVSKGLVGPITKCLEQLDLLSYFAKIFGQINSAYGFTEYDHNLPHCASGVGEHLLGKPDADIGLSTSKPEHIKQLIQQRLLECHQVVVLDDDIEVIKGLQSACKTIHVASGQGANERELHLLRNVLNETNCGSCVGPSLDSRRSLPSHRRSSCPGSLVAVLKDGIEDIKELQSACKTIHVANGQGANERELQLLRNVLNDTNCGSGVVSQLSSRRSAVYPQSSYLSSLVESRVLAQQI